MLVKLDQFPKVRGENKTYLKAPPSWWFVDVSPIPMKVFFGSRGWYVQGITKATKVIPFRNFPPPALHWQPQNLPLLYISSWGFPRYNIVTPLEPWKMIVGRLLSFWGPAYLIQRRAVKFLSFFPLKPLTSWKRFLFLQLSLRCFHW